MSTNCTIKHEEIRCARCNAAFECKAGTINQCQCSAVRLDLNESQYISEKYDTCLCAACLLKLQQEYRQMLVNGQ